MFRLVKATSVKRGKLYVDPQFQRELAMRVVIYWFCTALAITLMLLCGRIVFGQARSFLSHFDDMWVYQAPALLASLLLLPAVIMDVLKLSNRFVGPIMRLRSGMRSLARGEMVKPIKFREGDFWQDFAVEFNTLAAQMQRLREDAAPQEDETAAASVA